MIEFVKVTKQYQNTTSHALNQLDLQIEQGELVVVVGPSGSGKSTLLELICGFEDLTEGTIKIDGESIEHKAPKDREVGMVFQNYALLPHMTVYENIVFGMKVRKVPKVQIKEKVEWAAKILELEPYLKKKPKHLSGGQRQRVALARALVRAPKLFLMDEPLSNLDARLRDSMCKEIKKLQQELGVTMIYVTHDQVEAMTLADKIAILKEGQLQQYGSVCEIYDNPANLFVAQFIGRPTINLLDCTKTEKGLSLEGKFEIEGDYSWLEDNQDYILGIRSEDMEITQDKGHIQATIKSIQYLGNETLLELSLENKQLTLKNYKSSKEKSTSINYKEGMQVEINFNLDSIHYFNAKTQNKERLS